MKQAKLTGRFRVYQWGLRLLLLLYFAGVVWFFFSGRVRSPGFLLMFSFGLPFVLGLGLYFALSALIRRRWQVVTKREANAARMAEEAARFAELSRRSAAEAPATKSVQLPQPDPLADWAARAARYVPASRRAAVYTELMTHLEEHYAALLPNRDPTAAARIAITAMGDADQVGRELRRTEWTPKGLARHIRAAVTGSGWTELYRGSDSARYSRLTRELTRAQIPFRTEELDGFARSIMANPVPGRSPMDNTPRRDGSIPSLHAAILTQPLRDNFPNQYIIRVRRRDLPAATRLHTT